MISNKANEVLKSIEQLAKKEFLPIIGPDKGQVLVDVIRKSNPKRVLEVGTLIGYSAILIAKELGDDAEIITIEIDEDEAEIARKNLRRAEVKPRVEVVVGNALDVIPKLNGEFDMVFLDASKNEYIDYLKLVEDKLKKGGVVAADNAGIFASSMRDFLRYVRKSGKYESRFVAMGEDGVEISFKL
jgi:predicted O-methyltransferase YrrM